MSFFRNRRWKRQLKMAYQSRGALAYVQGWVEGVPGSNPAFIPWVRHFPEWDILVQSYDRSLREGPLLQDDAKRLTDIDRALRIICGDRGPVILMRDYDETFKPTLGWADWLQVRMGSN